MHLFIIHQFPDLDELAPIIYKLDHKLKGKVKILSMFPVHDFKKYKVLQFLLKQKIQYYTLSKINLKNIEDDLKGYNACFFSLGVSSIGISKEDYEKITYELTMHFAKTFLDKNKDSIFTYVTGAGTDSTEKGKVHWARVKGKTENRILDMPFRAAYMFRPGYIHPYRGVGSKIIWVSLLYGIFGILYQILKFFPRTATNSINMGRAMIYCLNGEYKEKILNNKEINEVAKLV